MYLSGVPAWRSTSWVPFGGATARNADMNKALKLQSTADHVENAPPKRMLDDA